MELEKAIEELHNFKSEKLERDKLEINPGGGFKMGAIYKYTVLNKAIDTVLKELENRIPVKKVENKIEEYKNLCHKEKNDSLRSEYFHRYASLEELLYKEM